MNFTKKRAKKGRKIFLAEEGYRIISAANRVWRPRSGPLPGQCEGGPPLRRNVGPSDERASLVQDDDGRSEGVRKALSAVEQSVRGTGATSHPRIVRPTPPRPAEVGHDEDQSPNPSGDVMCKPIRPYKSLADFRRRGYHGHKWPCLRCRGWGFIAVSFQYEQIETIPCEDCGATGQGTKQAFLAEYRRIIEKYEEDLRQYKVLVQAKRSAPAS